MEWYGMVRASWKGLFVAILFSNIGLGVRLLLMSDLGNYAPYLTFYPVVLLTALYSGLFAGLLATAISAFSASFFFIEPRGNPFVIDSANDLLAMYIFILSCLLISGVCEVMHSTKRKVRERTSELATANQEITEILESITDGFFTLDDNLCFVYSNREAEKILRISHEELFGKSVLSFYAGQSLDENQKAYLQALKEKRVFHGEIMGVVKQGSWYEVHVYPKKEDGISVYVRDVTERRQIQERSREQADLLDLAHDFIMVRDLESKIIYWNHGAEAGYKWSVEEAIGQVTHELLQTEFPESSKQILDVLTKNGKWEGELIHTIKDGTKITVRSSQSLRKDRAGNPMSILEINHDITLQKRAEEQLLAWNVELENKVTERTLELLDSNSKLEEEAVERHAAQEALQELNSNLERIVMKRTQELQDMNATLEEEVMERQDAQESLSLFAADLEQRVADRTLDLQDINVALEEEVMERQVAQEALQEEKERYEALLQQSAEAVALIDLDSKQVVEINNAFIRMFGYSAEKLKNTAITDLGLLNHSEVESINSALMQGEILRANIRHYQSNEDRSIQAERTGSVIRHRGKKLLMLSYHDVTEERKLQATIQGQLELAAEVQKSMLPPDYQDKKLIVKTIFEPVMLVSGDFYGYHWSSDGNRLNGYLIDVTGHGVATSLYSSAANSLLNEAVSDGKIWTVEKVAWINLRLAEYLNDVTFVALIAFTFDFENKILTCIAGGINYILASTKNQTGIVSVTGIYLGVTETPRFKMVTMPIQNGNNFYFMTDGIYERLPKEIVDHVQEFNDTVEALKGIAKQKTHDDCSALCFHISGVRTLPMYLKFSRQNEKSPVRSQISQVLSELTGQENPKIEVALGEAIANSLQYSHEVCVKINKIGQRLILRVRGDGPGFDGNAVVEKNSFLGSKEIFAALIGQERGRGIPIMVLWSDKVIYSRKGNEVMLISRL